MNQARANHYHRALLRLSLPVLVVAISLSFLLSMFSQNQATVLADPITPPDGKPKLSLSLMTVTPTLAKSGGATISYTIEIRNTGAYTAENTVFSNPIPASASYNGDASATDPSLDAANHRIEWHGDVGFDQTVIIRFSVDVSAEFSGTLQNTAVISQSMIGQAISLTAETMITDKPILIIDKRVEPPFPGANKPMTYTLMVTNQGQPAENLPITVTDEIPNHTQLRDFSLGGSDAEPGFIHWNRDVTLDIGETTEFTFSVDVGDVSSGTVIYNAIYGVNSANSPLSMGEPHSVTVISPIFTLAKTTEPDPPGSNRQATYILSLFNNGSQATDLVITDTVPAGVSYADGGSEADGIVTWTLPQLESFASAEFTYTVDIGDVADIEIVNEDFAVCSLGEGVCQAGQVLTSMVEGPVFETTATLIPIAKKPGGGNVLITPTLTVHNAGNGNALDATVVLTFARLSLTDREISAFFSDGSEQRLDRGPDCGNKCRTFPWSGNMAVDETITFTLASGTSLSTIGGAGETEPLVAAIMVTDTTSNGAVFTDTARALSQITEYANVSLIKSAPPTIGPGQLLTYTIVAKNNGFTTNDPPVITDVVPLSTTVFNIGDNGQFVAGATGTPDIISWTLEVMGPGDEFQRAFSVRVDDDLLSGTQIINNNYLASGYGNVAPEAVNLSGPAVTTTVREIGLIDSFKEVTPTLVTPGPGHVLTYFIHVVNSSPVDLTGVEVYDLLPWEASTYQRDAQVASGQLISDIVSLQWTGDVGAYSEKIITLTVVVDSDFSGPITNTAVISHADLAEAVRVEAVAYVTNDPVLRIDKWATPDPVSAGEELEYTIRVTNLGQQATGLVITDVIPAGVSYVPSSATAGGQLDSDQIQWQLASLEASTSKTFSFEVIVGNEDSITNEHYGVRSAGGFVDIGRPLTTTVVGGSKDLYLPLVLRN